MADSGSVLTKSGELSEATNWYYWRKGKRLFGRFKVRFQIAWANTQSPDALVGAKLRLAGKNFIVHSVYRVEQWDKTEIEVYCIAFAEDLDGN